MIFDISAKQNFKQSGIKHLVKITNNHFTLHLIPGKRDHITSLPSELAPYKCCIKVYF